MRASFHFTNARTGETNVRSNIRMTAVTDLATAVVKALHELPDGVADWTHIKIEVKRE